MSKNIVIFADGTGQEGGVGNNTNVYDLFNMITDRTPGQISYYDRGLGTGVRKVSAMSGFGISQNVRECYQFLAENFASGDRIYLFGFSRGAATVRILSTFIHLFGILPRSRPELVQKAWRIYRIRNADKRRRRADDLVRRNHTMWTRIRFLGAWDSVAALGLPFKGINVLLDQIPWFSHSFHDLNLAPSVEYARHALAVDDERLTFHPLVWDEIDEPPEEHNLEPQDVDDVYLVAHKLKTKEHPVTKRLRKLALAEHREHEEEPTDFTRVEEMLRRATAFDALEEMLKHFDANGTRAESPERVARLKKAIVDVLRAVEDSDEAIYDPKLHDEFDSIALSPQTQECMDRFRKLSTTGMPATSYELLEVTRKLNRLVIADAYALRPARRPRLKQVWFPGMHSDVGGGYRENELAHVSLVWMVREAVNLGLQIYPRHRVDLCPSATGVMHDSRADLARFYRRRTRRWNRDQSQGRPPIVHESVLVRSRRDELRYEPWILKTKYDTEPWPTRLTGSIQYDDHHIWREAFWGWDGAFSVPWRDIEHIACNDEERTITLHLKDREIVIEGSLPKSLTALVEKLSRRRDQLERGREDERLNREDRRLRLQDERLKQQDEILERLLGELQDKVNRITLERRIVEDNVRDEDVLTEAFGEQDARTAALLEKLRDRIDTLERGLAHPRTRTSVESNEDDSVMH